MLRNSSQEQSAHSDCSVAIHKTDVAVLDPHICCPACHSTILFLFLGGRCKSLKASVVIHNAHSMLSLMQQWSGRVFFCTSITVDVYLETYNWHVLHKSYKAMNNR